MTVITRRHYKKPHLNLTPLIDVIFLLIVFFMLTSRFSLDTVLDASIAKASAVPAQSAQKSTALLILLDEKGEYKLWSEDGVGSDRSQPLNKLAASLTPILVRDNTRELVVVVNDEVKVQQSVMALEAAKLAGAENVRLAEGF